MFIYFHLGISKSIKDNKWRLFNDDVVNEINNVEEYINDTSHNMNIYLLAYELIPFAYRAMTSSKTIHMFEEHSYTMKQEKLADNFGKSMTISKTIEMLNEESLKNVNNIVSESNFETIEMLDDDDDESKRSSEKCK